MTFAFLLSLFALIATFWGIAQVVYGGRKIGRLIDVPVVGRKDPPTVSIVLSALNEAATIEPALQSLLALNYPKLEIVAVNDRSTDATPEILDAMQSKHSRLNVIHVHDLPLGWLGKNHALHVGASHAAGDFIIFTDADVVFAGDVISKAVACCEQKELEHLSLFPNMPVENPLLGMMLLQFGFGFLVRFQPWKIATSSRHFLGQGSFNMVRRRAYLQAGGHAAIPMAVIDDMMLGWLMKKHAFRQDALLGQEMVSVRWYATPLAMFKGLQKNVFAGFDYSVLQLTMATVLLTACGVWPWLGLLLTSGPAWWLNLFNVTATAMLFLGMARLADWSRWCLLFLPIVTPLTIVMWWQACLLTIWHGGIFWRGTFYPLSELKRSHPLR
jgi:hypothetical protein